MADSETPKKYQVGPWMTVDDVMEVVDAGVQAQRDGKLKTPEEADPKIPEDPHGMVALFASRLNSNLQMMGPRAATEDALVTVKRHLDASDFINMSSKTSDRQYVRVDRRPEKTSNQSKRGDAM